MGHISKRFKEISGKADSQKTYPLLEALEIIKDMFGDSAEYMTQVKRP